MDSTAHIFNPKDNSLEARIVAFKTVYQAWQNAEASCKFMDDNEWHESLGTREEIEDALNISIHSLDVAAHAFTKEDIIQVQKENLLEDHHIQEIIAQQRQGDMQNVRNHSQSASSFKQHNKQ